MGQVCTWMGNCLGTTGAAGKGLDHHSWLEMQGNAESGSSNWIPQLEADRATGSA